MSYKIQNEKRLADLGFSNINPPCFVYFWKPFYKHKGQLDEAVISQWYFADQELDGVKFPSAEHAMMYGKARLFKDQGVMDAILKERHPSTVKSLGRTVSPFDANTWNRYKYDLVKRITISKFEQNPILKNWLLNQPDDVVFVEASPYDRVWGVGLDEENHRIHNVETWDGENLLGFIATEVMQLLKSKYRLQEE